MTLYNLALYSVLDDDYIQLTTSRRLECMVFGKKCLYFLDFFIANVQLATTNNALFGHT